MSKITVIGCGLMGQAIAIELSKNKEEVLVWNRTYDKCVYLKEQCSSIQITDSFKRAIESSENIIIVLTDFYYDLIEELLKKNTLSLENKTFIQLSSCTSIERARSFKNYIEKRNAYYLNGIITVAPQEIGQKNLFFYAGNKSVFDSKQKILQILNTNNYFLGEDVKALSTIEFMIALFTVPLDISSFNAFQCFQQDNLSQELYSLVLKDCIIPYINSLAQIYLEDKEKISAKVNCELVEEGSLLISEALKERKLSTAMFEGVHQTVKGKKGDLYTSLLAEYKNKINQ